MLNLYPEETQGMERQLPNKGHVINNEKTTPDSDYL